MITSLFARRYLFSRNSRSVVNIISAVSIVAVAVPVAAMIILLSVFNGFESVIDRMRSACDADITVLPSRGATFAADSLPKERIRAVSDNIAALSYTLEQGAMLRYGDQRAVAMVRGVDDDFTSVVSLDGHLVSGDMVLQQGDDWDGLSIGLGLGRRLGIRSFITEPMTVYAINRRSFSTLLPVDGVSARTMPAASVFAIDASTDETMAFTSLRAAQSLFNLEGRVSAMNIRLREGSDPDAVRRAVEAVAGDDYRVLTRSELNATTYRLVRHEKQGVFLIAVLVLIVASLSIVGVLSMLVIEKRRDIATLRTLGARKSLVRRIFVTEGMLICSAGGFAGMVLGIAAVVVQSRFKIITIPARALLIDAYPVELRMTDVLLTAAVFLLTAWVLSRITVHSMLKRQL